MGPSVASILSDGTWDASTTMAGRVDCGGGGGGGHTSAACMRVHARVRRVRRVVREWCAPLGAGGMHTTRGSERGVCMACAARVHVCGMCGA
jgi:hypothetical protein